MDRRRYRAPRRAADRRCRRFDALFPRQRVFARRGQDDVQHSQRHRDRRRREDRHGRRARRCRSSPRARAADISHGARARSTTPAAAAGRSPRSTSTRRRTREVPHARGLDQRRRNAVGRRRTPAPVDSDGTHPRPPAARGGSAAAADVSRQAHGRSDARSAVLGHEGRRARAPARSIRHCSRSCSRTSKTGESRETGFQYGDLNHLQFNPVDPDLLLYCHEGTWHELRSHLDDPHRRQPDAADAPAHDGHGDQRPRVVELGRQDGVVRSPDAAQPGLLGRRRRAWTTGRKIRYHLAAQLVGRALQQLARRHALRQRRRRSRRRSRMRPTGCGSTCCACSRTGPSPREKLVNMSQHNYVTGRGGVEPNVHITPDKKWVDLHRPVRGRVRGTSTPSRSKGPGRAPTADDDQGDRRQIGSASALKKMPKCVS